MVLGRNGSDLLALLSNGSLYRASVPTGVLQPVRVGPSMDTLTGIAFLSLVDQKVNETAVVETNSGMAEEVLSPFSAVPTLLTVGALPLSRGSLHLALASVFGESQPDVLAVDGRGGSAAEYQGSFNASPVVAWAQDVSTYLAGSTPVPDAYGNPMVSVPLALTVRGGGARVVGAWVSYNGTIPINVTASLVPFMAVGAPGANRTFTISTTNPGEVHIEALLGAEFPVRLSPTPPTLWDDARQDILTYGTWIILATAAAGVLLLSAGRMLNGRAPRGRLHLGTHRSKVSSISRESSTHLDSTSEDDRPGTSRGGRTQENPEK